MGIRANALRAGLGTFLGTLGGDLSRVRQERGAADRATAAQGLQGRQRMGEMTLKQILEQMDPEKRAQAMATLQGTKASTAQTEATTAGLIAQNQREASGARTPQQDLEASRQQLGRDELSVRRGELEQRQAKPEPAPSVRAERLARLEEWDAFRRQSPREYLAIADMASGLEDEDEVAAWFKRPDVSSFLKKYVEHLAEQGQWEIGQTGGAPSVASVPRPSKASAYVDSSMPIPGAGGAAVSPVFSGAEGSNYRIGDTQEGPVGPAGPASPATPGGGPWLGPFAEKAVARAIAAGLSREQAIQQMIQTHGEAALAQ